MSQAKNHGRDEDVVYVPFSRAAYEDALEMAGEKEENVGRVIQESLATKKWVNDVRKQGGRVFGVKGAKRAELQLK